MPLQSFGIHWFRRDLRVAGNPALRWHCAKHQGRVVGLFTFDKKFLSRPDFSANRFHFFLETLAKLRDELRAIGSELLIMDEGPDYAFEHIFAELTHRNGALPHSISWNRDYEPFARERDQRLRDFFQSRGMLVHDERDHVLLEPHEIIKDSDESSRYQVYSPFARTWAKTMTPTLIQERLTQEVKGLAYLEQCRTNEPSQIFRLKWTDLSPAFKHGDETLQAYLDENAKSVKIPIPAAGSQAALAALKAFAPKLDNYGLARDIPSQPGTSRLSIFLKNGSLTTSQIIAFLGLLPSETMSQGGRKYLSELIWREFYYYIMFHHPRVEKEPFLTRYLNLKWPNRDDWFRAWQEGRTGYPIVDAGMRELRQTGWMHNRVRMIVASFLTKDLLIDWRWGERYFMNQLLDGDLAPNNGGWQWAASTGCDPQPYFRIFNPILQSRRFDPEGTYIRTYVPELAGLGAKEIHDPPESYRRSRYLLPIVDHGEQRAKALAFYKSVDKT